MIGEAGRCRKNARGGANRRARHLNAASPPSSHIEGNGEPKHTYPIGQLPTPTAPTRHGYSFGTLECCVVPHQRGQTAVVTANRLMEVRKLLEEIKGYCGIGFCVGESFEEFGGPGLTIIGFNVASGWSVNSDMCWVASR